ncbi:MAG: protein kinase [Planctomycetaceae bacterium]|nr:MAG: protein kinase [Planctomycetaceae bacterium]
MKDEREQEPSATPEEQRLDEALVAYLRARDSGQPISREAFLDQFPELADKLEELLRVADSLDAWVGRLEEPAPAETIAWGVTVGFDERTTTENIDTLPMPVGKARSHGPTLPYDLGDYTLQQVLGQGGMGVVYLAVQKGLGRQVAVKMIRSGVLASEVEVRRFTQEARAAASLQHPHIVSVYQSGFADGHHFFSMEYVPGVDLAKRIGKTPLDPRIAARYVRDVARAIDHAHARGVLHRDLKPANVLITSDDQVRVTDFGLAKTIETDQDMTGSGTAIGTPGYMAPEQASGQSKSFDETGDVYSLGAILFATLTGRPPFAADGIVRTMLQVIHQPAPAVRSIVPDVPEDLDTIVAKCLEKTPKKRYPSAAALADELDAFLEGRPILARPRPIHVRVWHWLRQVPLIAALGGHRVIEPTRQHQRFQAAALALLIALPLMVGLTMAVGKMIPTPLPDVVRLAGGSDGGVFDQVTRSLAERISEELNIPTEVVPTGGSIDNRDRLLSGEVHLAPMQSGALGNDELAIVAPLFFEAIHVAVRVDSGIDDFESMAGHPIAVGPAGTSMRLATEAFLQSVGLPKERCPRRELPWNELLSPPADAASPADLPPIAVLCVGKRNSWVESLFAKPEGGSPAWRLLPVPQAIEISLQHPSLRPMRILPSDYPEAGLPEEGISTVCTTAFLVTRFQTPDRLVTATLQAIYRQPRLVPDQISPEQALELTRTGLHPAAKRYFETD